MVSRMKPKLHDDPEGQERTKEQAGVTNEGKKYTREHIAFVKSALRRRSDDDASTNDNDCTFLIYYLS